MDKTEHGRTLAKKLRLQESINKESNTDQRCVGVALGGHRIVH